MAWTPVLAQQPTSPTDTIQPVFKDSAIVDLRPLKISKDALEDQVDYGARDSMWFDVKNKQLHLYGQAFVKYTSIDMKAGYILLDYAKNEVTAEAFPDSSGKKVGLPEFQDGDQQFTATKLRYNFRSKKGIIYEARTRQEDLYVLGEKAKFVGQAAPANDTTARSNNTIYNQNALLTTCDDPHPHFGIRTKKLKVIPDKLVVTGFSNVEIGGVPTPLVLPFGFYPITKTRKSGLIIPRDFEFAAKEGLGIKDWGYYLPISEHMDLTFKFNIYTSGSWGIQADTRYRQLYRNTGNLLLAYNNRVTEGNKAERLSAKSYSIRWSHQQDPKAHPSRKFGGSINIETNRDQNRNRNDYASVYQNQLSSNLNYSKTFPGKPYQFNASLSHSQNTQTRQMNISFPTAAFNLQRIYPFKRKTPVGAERWYEKISLNYSSRLQNTVQVEDTLLFTSKTIEESRMGIQHQASTDFNFKLFKYINIAPRINYEENWYPYTIEKVLNPEIKYVYDTIEGVLVVDSAKTVWGTVEEERDWGFKAFRQYDIGISANTALFFTKQFKKGWFRGIRHTMKPSISTGWRPDYSQSDYFRQVVTSVRPGRMDTLDYSIYEQAVYGRPSSGPRDLAISYGLGNVLEMKYFSAKKDTIRRIRIFDNLNFSGSYSLTRDTLKWSTVGTGGLFRLFKGISNLTWNVTFDPYMLNEKGTRVNRFTIKEQGKLVRLASFSVALNTQMSIRDLRNLFSKEETPPANSGGRPAAKKTENDDFLGWFDDFRVSHRISFDRRQIFGTNRDTFLVGTNNISFSGNIPLTPKWAINVGNISYDFQAKSFVYPDIGFTRDLHCWMFSLRWQPLRGTYEFFITVKPGTLDFLKVPYRKNYFDAQGGF
ncbi:MAG: LPS-assembly protein LptD [Saprospiraceae bacterium]|nr:LPS-assembly protein LptD [Saprospiraceae bacterium]